jgi:hypothetical protein
MFDPLSTQFSAVQKETHAGTVGNPTHECQTYAVLYGTDAARRPFSRRRTVSVVAFRVALALIGLMLLAAVLV